MLSRTEFVKRRMFSPPDIFRNVLFFAVMLYIFNQLFCDCVLLNFFFFLMHGIMPLQSFYEFHFLLTMALFYYICMVLYPVGHCEKITERIN